MLIPIGDVVEREKFPWVNYLLILINVVVFGMTYYRPEAEYIEIVNNRGLVPADWSLLDGLTSMFLHDGWVHIIGNMLILWIVGDNVEDRFGHLSYVLFYLAAGAAAAGLQVYLTPEALGTRPMIGASGAVAGTMGAYLILFPQSRIRFMLWFYIPWFFKVPAWTIIILWLAMEGFNAWQETQGYVGSVAVWAHLGGFVFGFLAALLWKLLHPARSKDD